MKRSKLHTRCSLFIVVALYFLVIPAIAQEKLSSSRKVLFVIVDGIPSDVIEKLATPSLDRVAKEGRYMRANVGGRKGSYSETPTISAVGYNSLLTGTWANKHNVWNNDISQPNYHYPTIFRLVKNQYPEKKLAVFSSWEDNRTKLVGENLKATNSLKLDFWYDGLEKDTSRFPHDKQRKYMHLIDEAVVEKAAATISSVAPDLTWVYLEYTDDVAHMSGDGEDFYKAVTMMDNQVGRLWKAVESRQKEHGEEWQVYITTDHGRDSINGKGHGGQSDRERSTWIVTNAKGINEYFYKNKPSIVDIIPSISRFMQVNIPRDQALELDGVSITGKLSAVSAMARLTEKNIEVSWTTIDKKGSVKIWIALDNKYRLGEKDNYILVGTFPITTGKVSIDRSKFPSKFYKVVIEAPANNLNCWVAEDMSHYQPPL